MIVIDSQSRQPIYEQICTQIKNNILSGELKQEEMLPSVRTFAKELRVSALTVKKAYDALEQEGFIVTVHGKGSFVSGVNQELRMEEKRKEVGKILRTLCEWKKVKILEAEVCPDHVHMLLEIPPKVSVSSFMGYLKGKSSLMIYEKYPELKYKYRNREFWCRGYYVDTAGKNAKKIEEYIRHQLEEDKAGEQLTMGNF